MKTFLFCAGCVFLLTASSTYAGSEREQNSDLCIKVTIQNESENRSSVRQNCERNINRTVQAGAQNQAQTVQTGQINDNKVRQYQYDRAKYLERMRGKK